MVDFHPVVNDLIELETQSVCFSAFDSQLFIRDRITRFMTAVALFAFGNIIFGANAGL